MLAASVVITSGQIIALAFPALVGTCVLIWGLFRLAAKRLPSASFSTINAVTPGQVAIRGTATGPYSITAPITGKACYLYRTTVWQQKKSQIQGWEKLTEETLHVPFFVEDSSGQMLIEPLGADLALPLSLREEYAASAFYGASTIPPAINVFLARHRITPTTRILIEESCIEPKSDLFVAGTVTENPGVEVRPLSPRKANGLKPYGKPFAPDDPEPEVVHLSSLAAPAASDVTTQQSRIAAALLKAGIQNPNAWRAAGVPYPGPASTTAVLQEEPTAEHEPARPAQAPSGFNLKPEFVLMKGPEDAPFVLSSRAIELPKPVSHRKPLLLVSIGGTLALASLWIFLSTVLR